MRLDAERLALLDGGVAIFLGKSWTTRPNTSVNGTKPTSPEHGGMSASGGIADVGFRGHQDRF